MTVEKCRPNREGDPDFNACILLSHATVLSTIYKEFKENILSKKQWRDDREVRIVVILMERALLHLATAVLGLAIAEKIGHVENAPKDMHGDRGKLEYYYDTLDKIIHGLDNVWLNLATHIAPRHQSRSMNKILGSLERACEDLVIASLILRDCMDAEPKP
jgi:hypothetical protein